MTRERPKAPKTGQAARPDVAAITVRLPREEYEQLREQAEARGISLNSLAAEALTQYRIVTQRREVLKQMKAFRAQLPPLREGEEDSVTMLRRIRLERVRHLSGEEGSDKS